MQVVEDALLLCVNAHRRYLSAPPAVRRQLNQAVFTRFWIIDDQVHGADLTETFAHLLTPDLADRLAEKPGGEAQVLKFDVLAAPGIHTDLERLIGIPGLNGRLRRSIRIALQGSPPVGDRWDFDVA